MLTGAQLRLFPLGEVGRMGQYNRRAFWFFLVMGTLFLTAVVARLLDPGEEMRLALLVWQQSLFIIGAIFGARREIFGPVRLKTLVQGLLCGVGLYLVVTISGALTFAVARHFLGNQVVQELIFSDRAGVESLLISGKPLVVLGVMLLTVLGAPLSEELFFRGLLVDLLNERLGPKRAVFLAALLFAALHFYVLQFLPVLLAGILLGIIFLRSENIFLPIIAHAVVNGLTLLIWLLSL